MYKWPSRAAHSSSAYATRFHELIVPSERIPLGRPTGASTNGGVKLVKLTVSVKLAIIYDERETFLFARGFSFLRDKSRS